MSNNRPSAAAALIVLGIIGAVIVGTLLLYGTIAAVVIHFVRKFW